MNLHREDYVVFGWITALLLLTYGIYAFLGGKEAQTRIIEAKAVPRTGETFLKAASGNIYRCKEWVIND